MPCIFRHTALLRISPYIDFQIFHLLSLDGQNTCTPEFPADPAKRTAIHDADPIISKITLFNVFSWLRNRPLENPSKTVE